jgi:tRNA(adenine34) deaminase
MPKLTDEQIAIFMDAAFAEAEKAEALGEVPIGAVVVNEGVIVGRGHNLRETQQDATLHAEFIAIQEANQSLGSWRLPDAQLFVTLEPCIMCAGLIQQTRITDVYFGAVDPKAGGVCSMYHLLEDDTLNHQVEVHAGVQEERASEQLKTFFKAIRARKKLEKQARKDADKEMENMV